MKKKRFGDRNDGYLVRDADSMHKFSPFIMPNRADNEAALFENIDIAPINEYVKKKNEDNPEFKYTFFHVVCAALGLVIAERPRMNRFYSGQRLYERKEITFSFVVKKMFTDDASETLAVVKFRPESDESCISQIYSQIKKVVFGVRKENKTDGATDVMDILCKFPRPMIRFVVWVLKTLEYHGRYPKSFSAVDPYYTTCFISNLGSIKMNAQYHHLSNWGTNSLFLIIGEKKMKPNFKEDGSVEFVEKLPLGITVDERIADGVYFAKTVARLREILANPEILEKSFSDIQKAKNE